MAIHTYSPNRARQMAAMRMKDRAQGMGTGDPHVRIFPLRSGHFLVQHHNFHAGHPPFPGRGPGPAGLTSQATFPTADALYDHLDSAIGDASLHRPVGQHLAVHVPQITTLNSPVTAAADEEV